MTSAGKKVGVGDVAPDFTAAGTGGRTYSSADYRGRALVLVFYPGDATPVCTEQLRSYSSDIGDFTGLGAEVLALSPQDLESKERFAAEHRFSFPLLYDENRAIAEAYGVLGPLGFYRRSVFVIDRAGTIRYAKRTTAGLSYTPSKTLLEAVREAGVTPTR